MQYCYLQHIQFVLFVIRINFVVLAERAYTLKRKYNLYKSDIQLPYISFYYI